MTFTLSPFLFSIGNFGIRYYSLVYLIGLAVMYFWLRGKKMFDQKTLEDFCVYAFFAIIIGGRLGYIVFYAPQLIWQDPLEIIKIWHGGMSFHGGLIGLIVFTIFYAQKKSWDLLALADLMAVPGLFITGLGRIGNFLNGELWGRVTTLPWCFQFPGLEGCRHPSQLYQTISDWIFFGILFLVWRKNPKKGVLSGLFLIFYGLSRSINEIFFREPSWVFYGITAGTWLSIPMIFAGIILLIRR